MTGHKTQVPLLSKMSAKARRKKGKKKQQDCTINMGVVPSQPRGSPHKLERLMSVTKHYNDLDIVQPKYTDELLQKVEAADYEGCEELLELHPERAKVIDEETKVTPLHVAARNGQQEILTLLLNKSADCNAQDVSGQTPLHLAAIKDHYYICQSLLACPGIMVNIQNKAHDTPLHLAAKEGRYNICRTLLDSNADINVSNLKGMSPLHLASQENHGKVIQLLLDRNANWNQQDKSFYLPIHYAAQKGYPESCEVLMKNLDAASKSKLLKKTLKDGKTPLILAAKGGHHKCCSNLTNGNINAKDKERNTAVFYASVGGFENTIAELLEMGADPNIYNKKGDSPIIVAAFKRKSNCLKLLVEKGATLNVMNNKGKTVLHCAAEKNSVDCLEYLLSRNSQTDTGTALNINQKDSEMCAPLHIAIKCASVQCAELLLDHGASPTDVGGVGMDTPLHLAAFKGLTGLCEKLLAMKEVEVSKENNNKATPLHVAALHGSTDVCQMLIRKGARVSAVDWNGRTPLHIAAKKGNNNVVKLLIKMGASQKVRDDTRSTALHLAASSGSLVSCKNLFNSAKATLSEVDQNGKLPLDKAFESEHDEVFKFLLSKLPYKGSNEERILMLHEYMHTAQENDRVIAMEAIIDSEWWESGFHGKNGHHCQIFRELIKSHPKLAKKAQDKCINQKECSSPVTYDFRFFEDNYYVPTATSKIAKSPYKPSGRGVVKTAQKFTSNNSQWKKNHPLSLMVGHQRSHLLLHPLTNAWLMHKWRQYVSYIFLGLLFLEIIFVAALTVFMTQTDNWSNVSKHHNFSRDEICNTESNTTKDEIEEVKLELLRDFATRQGSWIFLLLVAFLIFLTEINYLIRLKRDYLSFDHWMTIIGVLFTIFSIIPVSSCNYQYQILYVTQWQCGIIALLVAWLHLINTLNQLPILSVFMPITPSFIKSFLKVLFYILMLVLLFAFLFHLLLRDQDAFSKVPQAMVKTIVWMLGDLSYDSTFLNPDEELLYPVMVNLFFVVFVTTIGGFIVNLAITQPSTKLDSFRERATYHRAASRCMLFLRIDVCFPYFRDHGTLGKIEHQQTHLNFLTRKLLMLDSIEETREPEDPYSLKVMMEKQNEQMSNLIKMQEEQREEIRDLKHQLNSFIKVTPGGRHAH